MPAFTDSHCHLDWFSDPAATAREAQAAGVGRIVIAATTRARWADVARAAASSSGVYAAYGLHPLYQDEHSDDDLHALETCIRQYPAVAIGECGLDFSGGDSTAQRATFAAQIDIARRHHLPLLLHARKSLDAVLHHLQRARYPRFVIHSFTGSDVQLAHIFALGGYIGIGGTSTYPRAARLQRQLATIPADRYLLETDAPDQPLCGYQGKPNHPARTALVAASLARLRGESLDTISRQSEENCNAFFAWQTTGT